jgi:hypothetical protein
MKFMPSKEKHTGLSSRLKEVLDIIHAKRPLIEYEVVNTNLHDEVTKVKCWQHGQFLGSIDADFKRYSNASGMTVTWFCVYSPHIVKERGDAHRRYIKSAKTAAKVAIDSLIKTPLEQLGKELANLGQHAAESAMSRIHSDFRYGMKFNEVAAMDYFVALHNGETVEPPKVIMDNITDKAVRARENFLIAKNVINHAHANNCYYLKQMKDETWLFTDPACLNTTSKVQTTYDLPDAVQEKLTMLKLLEHHQFAKDIGIKLKPNMDEELEVYVVVKGETVTY